MIGRRVQKCEGLEVWKGRIVEEETPVGACNPIAGLSAKTRQNRAAAKQSGLAAREWNRMVRY